MIRGNVPVGGVVGRPRTVTPSNRPCGRGRGPGYTVNGLCSRTISARQRFMADNASRPPEVAASVMGPNENEYQYKYSELRAGLLEVDSVCVLPCRARRPADDASLSTSPLRESRPR